MENVQAQQNFDERSPQNISQKRPLPQIQHQSSGHSISKVEWALVIGALALIDLIELIADLFAVGLALDTFIDPVVGILLGLYAAIRVKNQGWIGWFMATLAAEAIPVVNALPLWTLDGIYMYFKYKESQVIAHTIAKVPGGQLAQTAFAGRKNGSGKTPPPLSKNHQPLQNMGEYKNIQPNTPTQNGPGKLLQMQNRNQSPEMNAQVTGLSRFKGRRDTQITELNTDIRNQMARIESNQPKLEIQNGKVVDINTARERLEKFKKENGNESLDSGSSPE